MPQVPYEGFSRVAPTLPKDTRGAATEQAAGVGIARGVEKLGATIEKAGDKLYTDVMREQELNNATAAKDADNEFAIWRSNYLYNPENGYFATKGKAAVDQFPAAQADINNKRDEIANSMGNEKAKKLFYGSAQRQIDYAYQAIGRHAITENKRYQGETIAARVTNLTEDAALNWNDDRKFASVEAAVRNETEELGALKGQAPENTKGDVAATVSNLYVKRITSAASNDLAVAQDMYDKNKDKLLSNDRMNVEGRLRAAKQQQSSQNSLEAFAVKKAVENDLASIQATGVGLPDLAADRVERAVGKKNTEEWMLARGAAKTIWDNTSDLYALPDAEIQKRIDKLTPTPGAKDFALQTSIQNKVRAAAEDIQTMRRQDPAQSVANDPEVKNAIAAGDPGTTEQLADARMAAQERAGIPENARSPITINEALKDLAPMATMLPGQERTTLMTMAKDMQKRYGQHWERAFGFAVKSFTKNAEVAQSAATVLKKISTGNMIDVQDGARLDQAQETSAATQAAEGFQADPYGSGVSTAPIPAKAPPKKEPLSKRILAKMPKPEPKFGQNDPEDQAFIDMEAARGGQ